MVGTESPATCKRSIGDDEPVLMPTLPLLATVKYVVEVAPVDDAMPKTGLVWPELGWIEKFAHGVVVPRPRLEPLKMNALLEEITEPLKKLTPLVI